MGKKTPTSGTVIATPIDSEVVDATNTSAYFALLDGEDNVVALTPEKVPYNKKTS